MTRDGAVTRVWWLPPFLLAAYPILFLYAENIEEHVTLEPMVRPLAISLGATAAVLLVSLVVTRNRARAALIASLLVVLFFSYGHVWSVVSETLVRHRYLLGVWALLGLIGLVVILRVRGIHRALPLLAIAAAALVVINVPPILAHQLRTFGPVRAAAMPSAASAEAGRLPDIYYLIFDRYAGAETLEQIYGWDNTAFLQELERRGFYVAHDSSANYLKTAFSLLSSLNMDYLDLEQLASEAASPDDWKPTYRRLQGEFAVERFLHDLGYRYFHIGVPRAAAPRNAAADQVFVYGGRSEFEAVLIDTTLLVALENLLPQDTAPAIHTLYYRSTLYQFDVLDRLVGATGPKFVFAHFLIPHPPYVFNADGSRVTAQQAASRNGEQMMIEQLRFGNKRILEFLDRVLAVPAEQRPIVILQADEGPFPRNYAVDEEGFQWLEATRQELRQKFLILNAYYLPGVDPEQAGLYESITPVNSFRVVFNAYFGTELPLLPDRNWVFVDQSHLYEGVDVTDRVRS